MMNHAAVTKIVALVSCPLYLGTCIYRSPPRNTKFVTKTDLFGPKTTSGITSYPVSLGNNVNHCYTHVKPTGNLTFLCKCGSLTFNCRNLKPMSETGLQVRVPTDRVTLRILK